MGQQVTFQGLLKTKKIQGSQENSLYKIPGKLQLN